MRPGSKKGALGRGYSMTPILSHESPRNYPSNFPRFRDPHCRSQWSGRMSAGGEGFAVPAGGPAHHIPVLGPRAVELLKVRNGGVYIDATFGAGGYTREILAAAETQVIGIDRDQQ